MLQKSYQRHMKAKLLLWKSRTSVRPALHSFSARKVDNFVPSASYQMLPALHLPFLLVLVSLCDTHSHSALISSTGEQGMLWY